MAFFLPEEELYSTQLNDNENDLLMASELLDDKVQNWLNMEPGDKISLSHSASCPSLSTLESSCLDTRNSLDSHHKRKKSKRDRWETELNGPLFEDHVPAFSPDAMLSLLDDRPIGDELIPQTIYEDVPQPISAQTRMMRSVSSPLLYQGDVYSEYTASSVLYEEPVQEPNSRGNGTLSSVESRSVPSTMEKLQFALGPKSGAEKKVVSREKEKQRDSPEKEDELFSAEKAAQTAGSLWLLLHAWVCSKKGCSVPSCDVMKRVVAHCMECKEEMNECVKACNHAKQVLLHYGDCGKKGGLRAELCVVCSRLPELEKSSNQLSATKPQTQQSTVSKGIATNVGSQVRPMPVYTLPNGYQERIQQLIDAIIKEEVLQHVKDKRPLRSIESIRKEAELKFRDECWQQRNAKCPAPVQYFMMPPTPHEFNYMTNPAMLRPHSLPSSLSSTKRRVIRPVRPKLPAKKQS